MSRTSSRPAIEIPLERRQAEDGRVVADVDVELRADPAERLVHVERRRSPQPSSSMSPVIAARPGAVGGSDDGPDRHEREHGDERHLPVLDGPDAQAVARASSRRIAGNVKGRSGPERRQAAAIGRHQETATGCEPASASATRAARHDAEHDAARRA